MDHHDQNQEAFEKIEGIIPPTFDLSAILTCRHNRQSIQNGDVCLARPTDAIRL
jgi:hypothetical protein